MIRKQEIELERSAGNTQSGASGSGSVSRQDWQKYALAAVVTIATFFLRQCLGPWIGSDRPVLILFEIPVVISAYAGGMGPALLSTILIGVGIPYFVLPPVHSFAVARPVDLMQWALMIACAGLISIMSGMLYRSRRAAEANARLQAATIASIGGGIISTDASGRVAFLNGEAERLTGWTSDEAVGRQLNDVCRMVDSETRKPREISCLETRERVLERHLLVSRDGGETPVDGRCSRIRMADGTLNGAVLVLSDRSLERQAEQDLRESEHKYRTLFLNMSQGAFYQRADGRLIDANPAAMEIFGLGLAEFLGTTSEDPRWHVVREDGSSFPGAEHPSMVALKTGKPVRNVVAGIWNPGREQYVWAVINAIPQFRPGAVLPCQVFVTLHDVTEARRAEQQLRTSEQHFRSLVESAPDAIFIHTRGRFAYLNKAAADLFGAGSAEQLVGTPVIDRLHPDCHGLISERMRLLTEDKRPVPKLEHQYVRLDGSPVDVQASGVPFPYEGTDGALVFVRNISEQKQAEAALVASEASYRDLSRQFNAVLEGIPDSVSLISTDLEVVWANSSAIAEMDTHKPYVPGMHCYDLWHGRIEPCKPCPMMDSLTKVEPVAHFVSSKDGKAWEFRLIPLKDDSGVPTHIIRVARDITEHQKLEAQLREAQKMEAVGTLAGGIAHDFNNILAPIIGYTEMVMEEIPELSSTRHDLDQILRAAYRARDLVKQILAFSRRGPEQQFVPIEVSVVVKEVLKLLRASLPATIAIKQRIQTGMAIADPTQIHQIVVNLCTNAAHAMQDKGTLDVSLEPVTLGPADLAELSLPDLSQGSYLRLTVADTGHGMDPETIQRIFEPYFTTKEVGKGTGLGLAVVHGIVKGHGGEIRARSQPGQGSVFEVYLPMLATETAGTADETSVLPRGTERLLMVDDERMIVDLAARILGQLGYSVTAMTNPHDALDLFRKQPLDFDLIVTDYTMPGLTGIDLASEVLKTSPRMPIILCTGFSDRISNEAARSEGIVEMAIKPLDRRELAQLVRRVLDANILDHAEAGPASR
ncbi:MAG: PAS domain S-box protein [Syntrophobacteraceae bacterium]